jgi:hypothetical protein
MKLDIPFHDEVCEYTEIKKTEKTSLDLKVENKYGKILHKFKIFYYDWEMDNYGYVINDGMKNKLVTTNHGRLVEVDVNYLFHKIKEYENAIKETKEAIKIFEDGTN